MRIREYTPLPRVRSLTKVKPEAASTVPIHARLDLASRDIRGNLLRGNDYQRR